MSAKSMTDTTDNLTQSVRTAFEAATASWQHPCFDAYVGAVQEGQNGYLEITLDGTFTAQQLFAIAGAMNPAPNPAPEVGERGKNTDRRMSAVELLISKGYKWDGTSWQAPAVGDALSEDERERRLTAAMREADSTFERVGGSTRHYVRDCLMPVLSKHGLQLVAAIAAQAEGVSDDA